MRKIFEIASEKKTRKIANTGPGHRRGSGLTLGEPRYRMAARQILTITTHNVRRIGMDICRQMG